MDPDIAIARLFERCRYFRRSKWGWRLTARLPGQVHGLPGSRGVLVATDGVVALIEQTGTDGKPTLFEGHLRFFVPDIQESERSEATGSSRADRLREAREARLREVVERYAAGDVG